MMSTAPFEIIQEINQFFGESPSVYHISSKSSRFKENLSSTKRYFQENLLIKQLESLKIKVENLYRHCQSLQNENKVLKRIVSRSKQTSSTYSYGKSESFSKDSFNNNESNKYFSKVQNSNYFTNFSRQSQNSQKIQILKNELAGLSSNLKSMTKKFLKYELDSTKQNESKDFFVSDSSINSLDKKSDLLSKSLSQQIDLEYLLCHEDLSFDGNELQKKFSQREASDKILVDSLIAKGIQFRESRALRSKEFQNLSNIIQQYRSEFQKKQSKPFQKQSLKLKYR